jgi:hypothetical protein
MHYFLDSQLQAQALPRGVVQYSKEELRDFPLHDRPYGRLSPLRLYPGRSLVKGLAPRLGRLGRRSPLDLYIEPVEAQISNVPLPHHSDDSMTSIHIDWPDIGNYYAAHITAC